MLISDWSSDVFSSDLSGAAGRAAAAFDRLAPYPLSLGKRRGTPHPDRHEHGRHIRARDPRCGLDAETHLRAAPPSGADRAVRRRGPGGARDAVLPGPPIRRSAGLRFRAGVDDRFARVPRSEEHTSELQSLMRISYAVFS